MGCRPLSNEANNVKHVNRANSSSAKIGRPPKLADLHLGHVSSHPGRVVTGGSKNATPKKRSEVGSAADDDNLIESGDSSDEWGLLG
jgi:hypothetical protein